MDQQAKLDLIQYWLSRTTEEFDDWHYDGEELIIILKGKVIERYDNESLKIILQEQAKPSNQIF